MKYITLAAAGAAALFANVAIADAATHLSQSECSTLWQQANPSNAKGLTESQSAPYIANFKAVNRDGDTTIDVNEWNAACKKGLVKSTSSSGASSGDTGAAPNAAEHAPNKE